VNPKSEISPIFLLLKTKMVIIMAIIVGEGFTICPATNIALYYTFSDPMNRFDRQFFENLSNPAQHDTFILVET